MENTLAATQRRAVYRSTVATAARPKGYPTALRCRVTQNLLAPRREELEACQILGPSTARVELHVSLKYGRKVLAAGSLIDSSLFSEMIGELDSAVKQDTNSIKAIGEARLIPDTPTACCVPLELWPLEGLLKQSMDSYRPSATLKSIELQLEYAVHSTTRHAPQGPAPLVPKIDFFSLIHVQPLVLPLKSCLRKVIARFINQNLLKQLPLVFNAHWQKQSLPKQELISRILTRFSLNSISDDLRVELNLHKVRNFPENSGKNGGDDHSSSTEKSATAELSTKLLELQLKVGKIPNTRISRPRVTRSPSNGSFSSGPDADDGCEEHASSGLEDVASDGFEDMLESDSDSDLVMLSN